MSNLNHSQTSAFDRSSMQVAECARLRAQQAAKFGRAKRFPAQSWMPTLLRPGTDALGPAGGGTEPFINTGALARTLARWKGAGVAWELFQQFVESGWKPLKRLALSATSPHRAKAPVLMRTYRNAYGMCGLGATLLLATTASALAGVHYVDVNSTNATPPYTNWTTAATNIQDAVDAAVAGDEIVVTNGIYATGGTNGNRVTVDKPLSVRSVNGPQSTAIYGDGATLTRCVYLTNSASLAGFTLTGGFVLLDNGGGIFCLPTAVVSNCVISGNEADAFVGFGGHVFGGGAYGGTLNNCTLTANSARTEGGQGFYEGVGGGASFCTLNNCTLTDNWADGGAGGAVGCTLNNCRLSGNGAGAAGCTLNNCTLTGNSGIGANGCTLNNCIVYFNSGPNYDSSSTLNYCCTTPDPGGIGNITNAPLFVDQASGNLRLQSGSPCINAGNNSYVTNLTDLDGNPRIAGGTVDMGAYEFQLPPQLTITLSGTNAILTWPTNVAGFDFTNYILQATTNLVLPSVWNHIPGRFLSGAQFAVVNPISGTQKFYRLSQQPGPCPDAGPAPGPDWGLDSQTCQWVYNGGGPGPGK